MGTVQNPLLMDVPMPIRTPRLLLRPKQPGDGAATVAAVSETWDDLHQWMHWAEKLDDNTVEQQEVRNRLVMAKFILREEFNLIGIEIARHGFLGTQKRAGARLRDRIDQCIAAVCLRCAWSTSGRHHPFRRQ